MPGAVFGTDPNLEAINGAAGFLLLTFGSELTKIYLYHTCTIAAPVACESLSLYLQASLRKLCTAHYAPQLCSYLLCLSITSIATHSASLLSLIDYAHRYRDAHVRQLKDNKTVLQGPQLSLHVISIDHDGKRCVVIARLNTKISSLDV
jgi:hypothetical protein